MFKKMNRKKRLKIKVFRHFDETLYMKRIYAFCISKAWTNGI